MSNSYPSNWKKIREFILERDWYTCQNCGEQGPPYGSTTLHVHHGVPLSKGGTNRPGNLTTYCEGCHSLIHNGNQANKEKTNRREFQDKVHPAVRWGPDYSENEQRVLELLRKHFVSKDRNRTVLNLEFRYEKEIKACFQFLDGQYNAVNLTETGVNTLSGISRELGYEGYADEMLDEFSRPTGQQMMLVNSHEWNPIRTFQHISRILREVYEIRFDDLDIISEYTV